MNGTPNIFWVSQSQVYKKPVEVETEMCSDEREMELATTKNLVMVKSHLFSSLNSYFCTGLLLSATDTKEHVKCFQYFGEVNFGYESLFKNQGQID